MQRARRIGIGLGVLAWMTPGALFAQAIEATGEEVEVQVGQEPRAAEQAALPEQADEPEIPEPTTADPERPPTCAARAREVAAGAVVRVRSGGRWGAGFVYGSPRTVVTAFDLVSLGQPVTVVTREGAAIAARVVGREESLDLAILETTEPVAGAAPLTPAPETSATIGSPVVALGHPFAGAVALLGERGEGLLRWSVSQGVVGAVNAAGVQADVALDDGHAGAPLLDCEGRVLGMVASRGILSGNLGLAVRAARIDAAIEASQPSGDFLGNLRLRLGIGAALVIDESGRVAGGGYLTLGATLFDRVSWMNRVGLFFGGSTDALEDELSVDRRLVRVESLLGYRVFVDIGGFTTLYIVPAIGASVGHVDETRRSVEVVPVPGCTPSATESCATTRIVSSNAVDEWVVRPAIGLTFIVGGGFEVGYTLEIDVDADPGRTFHAVNLGFLF